MPEAINEQVLRRRVECLTDKFSPIDIDGLLVVKREDLTRQNALYISGFSGSTANIVITPRHRVLLTDDRYVEQAADECPCFDVIKHERPFTKKLKEVILELGIKKLGYETNGLTVDLLEEIRNALSPEVQLIPTKGLIEGLRARKDPEEIDLLRKAAAITDDAFEHIKQYIKPGVSERELALELEFFMRQHGAMKTAFDIILVSGPRTTLQHGQPSDRKIEPGDFVLIDFGAVYQHYCSDMTRTLVVGRLSKEQEKVYNAVKCAQEKSLELLRAGAKGAEAARAARAIIEEAGYGDYTGHGLGHGVGLEVHEEPYIRGSGDLILEEGHVVTAEPGIYIQGWGGVRIEDTVVIRKDGCERLTRSSKDLVVL